MVSMALTIANFCHLKLHLRFFTAVLISPDSTFHHMAQMAPVLLLTQMAPVALQLKWHPFYCQLRWHMFYC
jgi:hypothetical protein